MKQDFLSSEGRCVKQKKGTNTVGTGMNTDNNDNVVIDETRSTIVMMFLIHSNGDVGKTRMYKESFPSLLVAYSSQSLVSLATKLCDIEKQMLKGNIILLDNDGKPMKLCSQTNAVSKAVVKEVYGTLKAGNDENPKGAVVEEKNVPNDVVSNTVRLFASLVSNEAGSRKRVAFTMVENYVRNAWKKYCVLRVMMNAKGVFFFKFSSVEGMNRVLESGPRSYLDNLHDITIVTFTKDGLSAMATNLELEEMIIVIPNVEDNKEVMHTEQWPYLYMNYNELNIEANKGICWNGWNSFDCSLIGSSFDCSLIDSSFDCSLIGSSLYVSVSAKTGNDVDLIPSIFLSNNSCFGKHDLVILENVYAIISDGSSSIEFVHYTEPLPSTVPFPLIVSPTSFVNSSHCRRPLPQAFAFVGAIIVPSNCFFDSKDQRRKWVPQGIRNRLEMLALASFLKETFSETSSTRLVTSEGSFPEKLLFERSMLISSPRTVFPNMCLVPFHATNSLSINSTHPLIPWERVSMGRISSCSEYKWLVISFQNLFVAIAVKLPKHPGMSPDSPL
nr:hypothetical protein [Tanacetum cinerariifolium]